MYQLPQKSVYMSDFGKQTANFKMMDTDKPQLIDLHTNTPQDSSAMDTLSLSSQVKSGHLPLDYNPFLPLQSNGEKVDKITQ